MNIFKQIRVIFDNKIQLRVFPLLVSPYTIYVIYGTIIQLDMVWHWIASSTTTTLKKMQSFSMNLLAIHTLIMDTFKRCKMNKNYHVYYIPNVHRRDYVMLIHVHLERGISHQEFPQLLDVHLNATEIRGKGKWNIYIYITYRWIREK